MGGDHHDKFHIPDWRKYKIDGIKELEETRNKLAAKGLKDPWLRNEVWRYHPENWKGLYTNMYTLLFRGFKYAVVGMILTVGVDKLLGISASKQHGHGHGPH